MCSLIFRFWWLYFTLKTTCRRYCSPLLPGYFPARAVAERLNRFAPVSVHRAWTNIFFPTPAGPARSSERIKGPLSWTHWEPTETKRRVSEKKHLIKHWTQSKWSHGGSTNLNFDSYWLLHVLRPWQPIRFKVKICAACVWPFCVCRVIYCVYIQTWLNKLKI